jgi:hypothetical protein
LGSKRGIMTLILNPYDFNLLLTEPGPGAKCAAVEIIDDHVVGQIVYHEIPHLGEFYIKPRYQRLGIGQTLLHRMEQIVPEYFTFPSTDASKAFFQKQGLKELKDLRVFRKEK